MIRARAGDRQGPQQVKAHGSAIAETRRHSRHSSATEGLLSEKPVFA
jgi:hypothetical protein